MSRLRALVNSDLEKIERKISCLTDSDKGVYKDINTFVNGSSKRIRSVLCLMYLKANNAVIDDKIINLLVSGELIHNASLLHDDVIDNSDYRRSEKCLHKKYDIRTSVLSGDYLLSLAVQGILELGNNKILDIFLNTTKKMSIAELNQYAQKNNTVDLNNYLEIIKGKTASLFQAILESAAILSKIEAEKANKFGELFGQLFQINNDCQKDSMVNDKMNGISTAVNILGIEKTVILKDNYKEEIRKILASFPNKKYSEGLEDLIRLL